MGIGQSLLKPKDWKATGCIATSEEISTELINCLLVCEIYWMNAGASTE